MVKGDFNFGGTVTLDARIDADPDWEVAVPEHLPHRRIEQSCYEDMSTKSLSVNMNLA